MDDFKIPPLLLQGVPMMKVSAKKQKRYIFRLDPDQGQIVWESKKLRIIPIENIKELRVGADARYYREQFQLAQDYEDRWLTIIYVLDGGYKTLHLIAATRDIFQMWDVTLRRLYDIRQQLMSGLGNFEMRQAIWEKQFWKGADEESDHKLDFDDVERMCRRLNINPSREDLLRRFKQADVQKRGYLDFTDFRRFVQSLKARPELDRLYKKLCKDSGGVVNYAAFEKFMRNVQKSSLSEDELKRIFIKYAVSPTALAKAGSSPTSSPMQNPLELAMHAPTTPSGVPPTPSDGAAPQATPPSTTTEPSASPAASPSVPQSSTSPPPLSPSTSSAANTSPVTWETGILTLKGLTSFLLSTDNSAFADQHGKIYHDMTRPLPEYYISSSHNTYLVGHQLVGDSTIEGYIRALLHSCRSVELDIYDGDKEPMIYHGRTLTTKVSLRDACQAINKYAFVASPYPIIISAEVHCGLVQQAMIADIMMEVFGDALISAPVDGRPKIDVLPSPEDLKGRVLLKAKNLYVSEKEGIQEREVTVDTESSSTETSASDSDVREEVKHEWRKAREDQAEMIKDLKSEFRKARNALGRVSSVRRNKSKSPSPQALRPKVKMSFALVALLVYTVGVKCRGLNKKEQYAPEHVFSLSENTANKILKQSMMDLIKHNRSHLVRVYPKGLRIGSTNYEPHRYWSAGCQLVAINWQTFDLGYMINHAMFQRNGRAGYVLKPLALRTTDKQMLSKRSRHMLDVKIISAQQLPRPKDSLGREIIDKSVLDPYVEVSIHIPDWTHSPFLPNDANDNERKYSPPTGSSSITATSARTITVKTGVVKNNGFNPVWEQYLSLPFDCVGDMRDLIFVRFAVKQEDGDDNEPLALYCCSLGSLNLGYRHLPLHDAQLSQYLFSTLFVRIDVHDV
ncbi:PLC-like phosphodiesterase [Panus rudis PR-1116 ss-1]|nr:PLC-like phosphodiesterase [Panus rudis PR-1116 ss-1]